MKKITQAQELFLSPGYFGDLIRQQTGDSASAYLRRFVMRRAQEMFASGSIVTQTADALDFDYPQHFTRIFKKYLGITPMQYRESGSPKIS